MHEHDINIETWLKKQIGLNRQEYKQYMTCRY